MWLSEGSTPEAEEENVPRPLAGCGPGRAKRPVGLEGRGEVGVATDEGRGTPG